MECLHKEDQSPPTSCLKSKFQRFILQHLAVFRTWCFVVKLAFLKLKPVLGFTFSPIGLSSLFFPVGLTPFIMTDSLLLIKL